MQSNASEKAVRLAQLFAIRDAFGCATAGDGPREQKLRAPIYRVHVAQGVNRIQPRTGLHVRYAHLITGHGEVAFQIARRNHPKTTLRSAAYRILV